ncbi:alpha/beta fold hydrolase [Marinomonas sp. 2405UD66-6]|uniref:alpha/beta fold hydrolase n=1 Tax=Marinomonas sp. 2405UD66-6 TaxID=3391834 RepID=UPI0039C98C93
MNKLLTTLLMGVNLVACVKIPKTVTHDNTLSFTNINSYSFHTLIKGKDENPVVIVVHGGPGGDFQYLRSLSALAENHKVIFYDQRGSGLSPRVKKSQLTVEQNLDDLNALVDHFSMGNQVKLIGHSWGGMLVSGYLSTHPEKVSHAVIIEPGMLYPEAAHEFVKVMKRTQSVADFFTLIKHMSVYPFVKKLDGDEGFDYVMTKILNQNKPNSPYQCQGQSMPKNAFIRGGFEAFNTMLKPIMSHPARFTHDLTNGLLDYQGELMMISSECSVFGYEFQQQYHQPKMPAQTVHIKAEKMGHNMITLNPKWSLAVITPFLAR